MAAHDMWFNFDAKICTITTKYLDEEELAWKPLSPDARGEAVRGCKNTKENQKVLEAEGSGSLPSPLPLIESRSSSIIGSVVRIHKLLLFYIFNPWFHFYSHPVPNQPKLPESDTRPTQTLSSPPPLESKGSSFSSLHFDTRN